MQAHSQEQYLNTANYTKNTQNAFKQCANTMEIVNVVICFTG